MAARNFEDLLQVCAPNNQIFLELILHQCAIPVFDGLFPNNHNAIVMDLLFVMAHWHGLAKLRMHSDLTLAILDKRTTDLGEQFRRFKAKVCTTYHTQELDREVDARSHRQAKESAKRVDKGKVDTAAEGTATRKRRAGTNAKGKEKAMPEDVPMPKPSRRRKSFNFQTYKFHALGDYVTSIRHFGTTDLYSTEPVCYISLPIAALTQISLGRIRASHSERQIPPYRSKSLCSPAYTNRTPPITITPH
jgi:hypothetical protein